jgi:type VI secretion system secreted protein VgrG
MPFDMTSAGSGKASRAIRLAQPYSGSGYGMHFPVHAGAELVWACVDGNVDRPLGLSTVPNPSRATPVSAQNKSQNLLRTAAGNEILMEDLKGETLISLKTTDAHKILLDDKDDKIDIISTKKHKVTMDDKNQNITVQTTDGHVLIMDDKNTKITVQSKNGHFLTIDDSSGGESITVSDKDKKNTFIIDITNKKLVIKTDEGSIDFHAPKGTIDIQATTLNIETKGDTTLKAANVTTEAKQDCKVSAANIKQEAKMAMESKGMTVKAEASTTHDIKGLNTTVEAGVNLTVKGSLVTVQSTGPNTIKGMPVMIN